MQNNIPVGAKVLLTHWTAKQEDTKQTEIPHKKKLQKNQLSLDRPDPSHNVNYFSHS